MYIYAYSDHDFFVYTVTKQEREAEVKEEVQRLREAMEHLSGSAQGLARQRDDARAALAKAKAILRRMGPVSKNISS